MFIFFIIGLDERSRDEMVVRTGHQQQRRVRAVEINRGHFRKGTGWHPAGFGHYVPFKCGLLCFQRHVVDECILEALQSHLDGSALG